MVFTSGLQLARKQTIIYGVKRGKVPNALRAKVPPQRKEAGNPSCLEQMSKLFNCWDKSAFNDTTCNKEITAFLTCANASLENYHKSGEGKKNVWNTQKLNELISKYSIVRKRDMTEKTIFLNEIIK